MTRWLALLAIVFGAAAHAADAPPKPQFVVHFQTGPKWDKALAPQDQPGFKEHSANLKRLRDAGTITFGARYEDLGMVFLQVDTLEAAKALMDADPGVKAGIFTYRVAPMRVFYPWKAAEQ